jgi:hypothetical protein
MSYLGGWTSVAALMTCGVGSPASYPYMTASFMSALEILLMTTGGGFRRYIITNNSGGPVPLPGPSDFFIICTKNMDIRWSETWKLGTEAFLFKF